MATTTIAVLEPAESGSRDPLETAPTYATVESGVRAVIGSPSFSEQFIGGQQQVTIAHLTADPCSLTAVCRVLDETTARTWAVTGVIQRDGYGLAHTAATLRLVEGESAGG